MIMHLRCAVRISLSIKFNTIKMISRTKGVIYSRERINKTMNNIIDHELLTQRRM